MYYMLLKIKEPCSIYYTECPQIGLQIGLLIKNLTVQSVFFRKAFASSKSKTYQIKNFIFWKVEELKQDIQSAYCTHQNKLKSFSKHVV